MGRWEGGVERGRKEKERKKGRQEGRDREERTKENRAKKKGGEKRYSINLGKKSEEFISASYNVYIKSQNNFYVQLKVYFVYIEIYNKSIFQNLYLYLTSYTA